MEKDEFLLKLIAGGEFTFPSFMDNDAFITESFNDTREKFNGNIAWGFIGVRNKDVNFFFFLDVWKDRNNNSEAGIIREFKATLDRETNILHFKETKI